MSPEPLPVKNCYLGSQICSYKKNENDCLGMACECLGCLKEVFEEEKEERLANEDGLIPLGNGLALEIVDLTSHDKSEGVVLE